MIHLLDRPFETLPTWLAERGVPAYRAGQVTTWLFKRRADGFDEMTDLPQTLRAELAEAFAIWTTTVAAHQRADDGTEKMLVELADGQRVECVLLRDDRHHRTVCLSTQVGCAMGCAFCASGMDGLVRNLTSGEILEQLLRLQQLLGPDERLSHIVVMGMGEPLANLDGLLPALAVAASPEGLGISARRITLSTVGLPGGIERLAREGVPYHLAVSLHAADDRLRTELIPSNRGTGVRALVAATDAYFEATGRRVTFEYVLLAGVNDRVEDADALVGLLRGRPALVNLIPFNPVDELPYRTPGSADVARFADRLARSGLTVKTRYRKGDRIDAACGQLRRRRQST
ncbi:MAG: 23S rRNA (adenine(2503)-C(2))-methyltransferase RlmN [Pirellulales bacterium]|nr:23S rRNA (adenine(2503)-C(2))-methyltransferase RlmN [Pirellulales bacterium]